MHELVVVICEIQSTKFHVVFQLNIFARLMISNPLNWERKVPFELVSFHHTLYLKLSKQLLVLPFLTS